MCKAVKGPSSIPNFFKGKVLCISQDLSLYDSTQDELETGIIVSILDSFDVSKIDPPKCLVSILGRKLELMADSGSPWTIITEKYCSESFGDLFDLNSLCKPDIVAQNFDGSNIDFMGFREVLVEFKESTALIKLYIAFKGVNVLGWRDQAKLGIVLNPRE